jgi:hypothetical protein
LNISYNDRGLAAKVTGPHTNMSYTSDINGNLVEAKNIGLGKSTKYAYDSDSRNRCQVNNPQGESSGLRYQSSGLSGKQ